MIIECKNCNKKFRVNDNDIPAKGRIVKCSNCSTQWLQKPIISKPTSHYSKEIVKEKDSHKDDFYESSRKNEFIGSDGKRYKFLGSQWAEILPSGKPGKLARKKITKELNTLSGRKQAKKSQKIDKSDQSESLYQETGESKGGMGIFNFIIVMFFFVAAIILALDTFKVYLIPFFPNLDNYLIYIFETLNNIYIIIKDFLNNYK